MQALPITIWIRTLAMCATLLMVTVGSDVRAADPATLPSLDVSIDFSGRFRVQLDSESAFYYQLVRAGSPEESSVVSMLRGTDGLLELRDPVKPGMDTYYFVRALSVNEADDFDLDGIDDVSELAQGTSGSPINPARSVEIIDGALNIPDRATFELLARRDDVPGAQNVREVKFLMTGVDTERPTLHFFNTNTHVFHFYFARDVLKYTAGMQLKLVYGMATADQLSQDGKSEVIIALLDSGKLHFRVFDSNGSRIDDLNEDQVRSSKDSLVADLKRNLAPYWETGVPTDALQTKFILDLNVIVENFLLTPFNAETYFSNTLRRNLAGSLIAHDTYVSPNGQRGIYTVEFWPTDPVEFEFVEKACRMVSNGMPFVDTNVVYHPASETQRAKYEFERSEYENSFVRTISTQDLFGNVSFTAMNDGTGFGLLRVASAGETLTARDVVIFRSLPNDLTHVAGIITEIPQTPLSHVNLKAIQNNTPNAYIKDASQNPQIAPLIGRYVRYEIDADGFQIREATQMEVDDFLEELRPKEAQFPERNLGLTEIRSLEELELEDSTAYGAKAANLAELRAMLTQDRTPDGFGVPFYFYDSFMKLNGFYEVARDMIADGEFQSSPEVREERLAAFRKTIKSGTSPQWMLDALQELHDAYPEDTSLRCRSSTNNEDLEDFNGAGLYDSFTHHPDEGHLIKSIRQVWAGLWTYRAFEERDFYRIDHFTAAMGVLVHPNYEDELANGVAVTKNLVNPSWPGIYVNVQIGEDLVTNPEDESIPEEFLVAQLNPDDWSAYELQYVRFSNRVPTGETVLSVEQAEDLARELATVQWRFRSLYKAPSSFAMEVEFKITSDGDLIIKQARPWLE